MRRFEFGMVVWILLLLLVPAAHAADTGASTSLPIELTEEEKLKLHEIGQEKTLSPPPQGPRRNPAEWEPSQGVIIRWPVQLPDAMVAEMSEDVTVTTIVANAAEEQAARQSYAAIGVNMSHVDFLYAPTNSIWVRDYGPWFIFNGKQLAIVDTIYNRPRPFDDAIPQVLGAAWNLPVFGMDLIHTGGNHMSNGLGMSASTDLVFDENPAKTQTEVNQLMYQYLGNDYTVLEDIQSGGIHHIDCWAKYLGPSTVMVKDVPSDDPTYAALNDRAAFLAQQISPWGVPNKVVRIFCPPGTYYTNSLILNGKVFVPLFGNSADTAALQTYRDAMPGYEVLGYTGPWNVEDALHCRTMGVPDKGELFIKHVPFRTDNITTGDYEITTTIDAMSQQPLVTNGLKIHYNVDGGSWQQAPLVPAGPADTYHGFIPMQPEQAEIAYYLEAQDQSGRIQKHPFIGQPWAHRFSAVCPSNPSVDVVADGPTVACPGAQRVLRAIPNGGTGPFSYQWYVDGAVVPGAVFPTFAVNTTGVHAYNCEVRSTQCISSRHDAEALTISWQAQPAFDGIVSVNNSQLSTCALDLTWNPATPACGGPIYYDIYRSTSPGFAPDSSSLLISGVAGTQFRDQSQLLNGRAYYYIVRAHDDSNGASESNLIERSGRPSSGAGAPQTLFFDDFESAAQFATWTVSTGPGPHTCGAWKRALTPDQRPPISFGQYALADSDACGSGSFTSTVLTSPVINAATAAAPIKLEFDTYYRYNDGDLTTVEVFDGSTWRVVWIAPAASVQTHQILDVSAYAAGNATFRMRFSYQNAAWDFWFSVDNVRVTGSVGGSCSSGSACRMTVNVTPNGGVSACTGEQVVLTATRNAGTSPFSYQWTEDGFPIPGATGPTLSISKSSAQAHAYNCRVGDAGLCSNVTDGIDVQVNWGSCDAIAAVPAGTEGGTQPLRARRVGDAISLTWDVTTVRCSSADYHLIWGWGRNLASHTVSGSDCSVDSSGSYLWNAPPDASSDWVWFLIVGNDNNGTEGSWGMDRPGHERSSVPSGACGTVRLNPKSCVP